MVDTRTLSPEGVAILETLMKGAGSPLLSDSVLRAVESTGLIQRQGNNWLLTEDGLRSVDEARERLQNGPQVSHGTGQPR
ncbi:hypothetical protein [Chenggangzhangella methanolivorans]|uniref:Uncharacterized protein n=1 Tax=Chenggangzhangella methanolivorans TaxID=1437009 RepID=A0A9E6URC4_9HYPH|nr:hypothetical protein [Chenggangzhangella methanolivorans]QZO02120.1 hypothetical protein K6K41_13120 [Chenggangzhangella methanolivorans]